MGLTLMNPIPFQDQWLIFLSLTILATVAQLFKANTPNRKIYYSTLVFVFAGLFLLHPFLFCLLIVISCSIEWAKERVTNSRDLRDWYLQPFNIAMFIISGMAVRAVLVLFQIDSISWKDATSVLVAFLAALVYVITNQLILTQALIVARNMSWKQAASVDVENVQAELIHAMLGYVVAVVWTMNPWLTLPAVAPLVLTYRALMVPQLRKEAATDLKTNLLNSSEFNRLFTKELERAKRFGRPMAVIMADLDHLRNINNTYGHLAGDIVISGIGKIINSVVREYDIAGRFGGEEFSIALPETEGTEAVAIAQRIRAIVERTTFEVRTNAKPIRITMSFGVACFPIDATEPNELIHQADIAVYQAKLKGRNSVVAASDIPRSVKLDNEIPPKLPENMAKSKTPAPSVPSDTHPTAPPINQFAKDRRRYHRKNDYYPGACLGVFVGFIIVLGLGITLTQLNQNKPFDFTFILFLSGLAILAEWFEVSLYGDSTFSVSVTVIFAAALLAQIPGVAIVSLAIAFTHLIHNRKTQLHQFAFNWSVHVLAGMVPVAIFRAAMIPLNLEHLVPLTILTLIAASGVFLVETGLVSVAIVLSEKLNIWRTWREQFRWTAVFYLAMSCIGMFMSIIYADGRWGVLGVVVFTVPLVVINYAQNQYVERTKLSENELKRLNKELSLANHQIVTASNAIHDLNDELFLTLAKMIDARDPYVMGHAVKVADYASAIAEAMGLMPERVQALRQAGWLHDIGKIGVAEQILHKPGKLSGLEYESIKQHTTIGAELLQSTRGLQHLTSFVRHHHERWDGKGYPDKLRGDEIPIEARILAVSDAIESMASDRPYHRALQIDQIIEELKANAGTQFDPVVAQVCQKILEQQGAKIITNSARDIQQKNAHARPAQPSIPKSWLELGEANYSV